METTQQKIRQQVIDCKPFEKDLNGSMCLVLKADWKKAYKQNISDWLWHTTFSVYSSLHGRKYKAVEGEKYYLIIRIK